MKTPTLTILLAMWIWAGTAQAYRPSGWTWSAWPYVYELDTGDWYWFNTANKQWVLGPIPDGGWSRMGASPLAAGWTYTAWPYAYDWEGHSWYYLNVGDTQWCVNLTSARWSRFGVAVTPLNVVTPVGMTLIPAGSFERGNALSATGDGYSGELPVHTVSVSAFHMDRHEVTKALWDEVRAWGLLHGYTDLPVGGGKQSNHPVHSVNWYAAVKWCNARSQKEARSVSYTVGGAVYKTGTHIPDFNGSVAGYRLPTEAEWEKAARGGASWNRFPWSGDHVIEHTQANYNSTDAYSYDTSTTRGYHPDYAVGVEPFTSPVGSFAPNGYGLYDMAGNLWEWCWDGYSDEAYALTPAANPQGPSGGSVRVFRGGSWDLYADDCRVAGRYGDNPARAGDDVGFRTVLPTAP